MYFPRNIDEVGDFLQYLRGCDTGRKLRIIDDALDTMMRYQEDVDFAAVRLLQEYKMSLLEQERGASDNFTRLVEDNKRLEREVSQLLGRLHKQEQRFQFIQGDVKSYKNLYIFILSHPKNNSSIIAEILSRVNYLDKMTRDVTFVMPGYRRAGEKDVIVNEEDRNLQLTFDENIFMDIIQKLEDQSKGLFMYGDRCELVFIGAKGNGEYDFSSFIRLDLDVLANKRKIDPVELILKVAQYFRIAEGEDIDIRRSISQILGEMTMTEDRKTYRVFIAGSKSLKKQRSMLREELSKVENALNLDIRSLTFEDFATSLTGEEGGRQAHYNKFIEREADMAIFVFDSTIGEITEEEFDVAYESLKINKRPEIFVYSRKKTGLAGIFSRSDIPQLAKIKERVFGHHKEYFVEYISHEELRYLFYSNMISFFKENFLK
jgi:hypothetical protein